jgi:hypothetical protein
LSSKTDDLELMSVSVEYSIKKMKKEKNCKCCLIYSFLDNEKSDKFLENVSIDQRQ